MNETIHPDGASDAPWPTSDHRVRVPDMSMLAAALALGAVIARITR